MTRQLLLMRQGASKREQPQSLHSKAKRRAQRMGIWLARHDKVPDSIICASNPLAIVTTTKMAKAMGFDLRNILIVDAIPGALESLAQEQQRVLIVGTHRDLQPFLTAQPLMSPGDLILLQPDGEIARHIDAKSLPKKFPYPDIHHHELRARPAYYYRQSSVIPYRIGSSGVEILLITSSSGSHWVVPKGIQEPGMTAAESAAKEAEEEAGILGVVAPEPLGSYRYRKWKSDCEVAVFAMQVTDELQEAAWQESHRKRQWCTVEEALSRLQQPALRPLIRQWAEKQ